MEALDWRPEEDRKEVLVPAVKPNTDAGWLDWKPEPGHIYTELPEETYHASPGISKHGLDNIARAPAYYHYHKSQPRDEADAKENLIIGSALDCMIFEPHLFDETFAVEEPDFTDRSKAYRNTKWYKAWVEEETQGRPVLRYKNYAEIKAMRASVLAQPFAAALLEDGIPQASVYWVDADERVSGYALDPDEQPLKPTYRLCRGRTDWLPTGHDVVVDLKSIAGEGGMYSEFPRHVHRYRYHVQADFYLNGLRQVGYEASKFIFLVVEKEPPHMCTLYELNADWMRMGRLLWERDIALYNECMKRREWPPYPTEPRVLDRPRYAEFAKIP